MPKARVTYKRTDLKRALKAAADAGMPVQRFEIASDGKMTFITAGKASGPAVQVLDQHVDQLPGK
jgi:hypothetical protein